MIAVGAIVAVFCCSVALTRAAREFGVRRALLDQPNARSAHDVPRPRLGGVAIVSSFALAAGGLIASGAAPSGAGVVVAAMLGVSVVGLVDDLVTLRARSRFLAQVGLAALVVALRWPALSASAGPLFGWVPPWLLAPIAVLWIVWVTNLYNFMDGIDGLAGGQCVFACGAVVAVAAVAGSAGTSLLVAFLAAAAAGFLVFNFPPASIFMGDAGSTAIGFFLACTPLLGDGTVSVDVVAVALSLFILDATVTLARRVARGERWYEAHRSHYYQRPLAAGVRHRVITLSCYVGFALVATTAFFLPSSPAARAVALCVPVAVFAVGARMAARVAHTARPVVDEETPGTASVDRA